MADNRAGYYKTYRESHKEEIASRMKACYALHKEERLAYQKTYNALHKKELAAYHEIQREKQAARKKARDGMWMW